MSTCQICGRTVKATNGRIAHHGYKRPGGGWQTASCMGARHQPYEVSRKQIAKVIDLIKAHIEKQEAYFKDFTSNPPATLIHYRYAGAWNQPKPVEIAKPYGFTCFERQNFTPGTYNNVYFTKRSEIARDIAESRRDVQMLTERYINWYNNPATKSRG